MSIQTHEEEIPVPQVEERAPFPQQNLRLPGPTAVPPEVLQAMSTQMLNHRGPEFGAIVKRITARLQYFFQTREIVFSHAACGTAGQESAVVNLFSPGDHVVALIVGSFGAHFADIASAYGLKVTKVEFPWGQGAYPAVVEARLKELEPYRGVFMTHNETSTGVTNDVKALAAIIRRLTPEALVIVDAISSLGCIPFQMDAWDLDVVITGSQKGWMVPPGLTMIAASKRAWEAHQFAKLPRYYLDWTATIKRLNNWQHPGTTAVPLFYGLDVSLQMMLDEGREAIFARHALAGTFIRGRVQQMGLELLADPRYASNTVTAVLVPEGIEVQVLLDTLRERDGVVLAGGQAHMINKLFRIGHLGYFSQEELEQAMDALEKRLHECLSYDH
jgi:aspartate aminotransferase-like enzyme